MKFANVANNLLGGQESNFGFQKLVTLPFFLYHFDQSYNFFCVTVDRNDF